MEGMQAREYLKTTKKRFDPISLILSLLGFACVVVAVTHYGSARNLIDVRSLLIVVIGTLATILFQFDFRSVISGLRIVFGSFAGTPGKPVENMINQLNEAIVNNVQIVSLREGRQLDGELLNDVVYMYQRGLLLEEIDEFITSRIAEQYLERQQATSMLRRAAVIAPALGLFGTVIGLVGVLQSMSDPSKIGLSMSLALMTTAYGAGLGSLLFTPLAGRLEHHNTIFLEIHKRLLSKVAILLAREERRMDSVHIPTDEEA